MRKVGTTLALIITVALGLAVPAAAEPGDLDGAFGTCGFLATPEKEAVLVLGDDAGRSLSIGYLDDARGQPLLAVTRRKPDGRVDRAYGLNGRMTADIGENLEVQSATFDTLGRLVVATRSEFNSTFVRFNPDGRLDSTFAGGIVTVNPGRVGRARAAADGGILANLATGSSSHS